MRGRGHETGPSPGEGADRAPLLPYHDRDTYGYDSILYSIGFLAGWIVALFIVAKPMKKPGMHTFADVIDSRFNSRGITLSAVISRPVVSLCYLIPQLVGAGALLVVFSIILVVVTLARDLGTQPDQGGRVEHYTYRDIPVSVAAGEVRPPDSAVNVVLVGLALAVAASADLPSIVMMLFWKRTATAGIRASIFTGIVSSVGIILASPTMYEQYGLDPATALVPVGSPAVQPAGPAHGVS